MTSTHDSGDGLAVDDSQLDTMPLLPEQKADADAAEPQPEQAEAAEPETAPAGPAAVFEPVAATPTLQQLQLSQQALDEIAPAGAVGEVHDALQIGEQVVAIRYASNLDAYPDWLWTASLATVDPENPTVLELALLPTEPSLLAPAWVPWADRLADYLASQEADEADDDSDDDDSDEHDDHDDFDDDEHFAPDDHDGDDSDDDDTDEVDEWEDDDS